MIEIKELIQAPKERKEELVLEAVDKLLSEGNPPSDVFNKSRELLEILAYRLRDLLPEESK